ncbi:lactate racemase domain-containing protein [Pseudalkalibacillus sp. R45]|uniref:lactate racemase domain-containing protein n=1 Tax=Pseudalkalibacillus sp. R45 TaxID=3457433 RepID=UPI003FCE2C7E
MIEMIEIEQCFPDPQLQDLHKKTRTEINRHVSSDRLPPNAEIAITAGSRGITNIVEILKSIVSTVKELGFKPFLVPAMGSHGGATAEGQLEVLKHLGITEDVVGAPIRSSMDVELVGHTPNGTPVYMDKNAYHANGIIVVNRVKAHTAFRGKVESGLSKMVTIGLGKIKGATFVHSNGALQMAENIESVSRFAIENSSILMGLAIIENGYDETADIIGVSKEEWHKRESELLDWSKSMMPSLPIDDIDLLVIEEMGKCFSGTGMDPNIIGRWRIEGVPEPESPDIKKLVILDLADKSFGNAQGIGLADFTTQRLVDKIDRNSTYTNALTSTYLQRAMLPLIYRTEKTAIETAIQSLGPDFARDKLKMVQIANTLHLKHVSVSKPVLEELQAQGKKIKMVGKYALTYDETEEMTRKLTIHS